MLRQEEPEPTDYYYTGSRTLGTGGRVAHTPNLQHRPPLGPREDYSAAYRQQSADGANGDTYGRQHYHQSYSSHKDREANGSGGFVDGGQSEYVGDRLYYQPPPQGSDQLSNRNTHLVLETKERKVGCVQWILTALLIIVSIILVVCIVLFLTIRGDDDATKGGKLPGKAALSSRLRDAKFSAYLDPSRDTSVPWLTDPKGVLTDIDTVKEFCLLDTVAGNLPSERAKQDAFEKEHIPGARRLDVTPENGSLTFTTGRSPVVRRREPQHPLEAQTYLRRVGVRDDCRVVLYDHPTTGESDSIKGVTFAAWLLQVYGHRKVSILHGGLEEWRSLGHKSDKSRYVMETGAEKGSRRAGDFHARWDPNQLAVYDDVRQNIEGKSGGTFVLVDARTADEYSGAINVPIAAVLKSNGAFRDAAELRRIFEEKGVLKDSKPIITYCSTGRRSSVLWYALKMLDVPVKNYGGGWVEFSHRAPVNYKVKGTKP